VREFCRCASSFTRALLQRLEREEGELFPIARAAVSRSAWFSMANQLLLQDVQRRDAAHTPDGPGRSTPVLAMMSVLND
jgi:hypothetical protein